MRRLVTGTWTYTQEELLLIVTFVVSPDTTLTVSVIGWLVFHVAL